MGGSIVDLKIGNTKVIAEMIEKLAAGDMFHIESVKAYPEDYTETTNLAKLELRKNARPEIKGHVENMDAYDVIFLGYPNWWGTMPMPVFTFLENFDFSGKTIVPFCTHEGSGLGRSEQDIKKLCPTASVLKGIAIRGGSVGSAKELVSDWINKSDIS